MHKYHYKPKAHTAVAKAVAMVGSGRRVLELGSGPGSMTRLLHQNQCRVTALERDPEAVRIVAQYCERVLLCNLDDANWPTLLPASEKFDVVVATDVLEHLVDPWHALQQLHALLTEQGSVVVSLPHVGHNAVVAGLLHGEFNYQSRGLLDKTHLRFFGIKDVQRLFDDTGYKIVDADFIIRTPAQTEFASAWRKLSSAMRMALERNRYGNIYQILVCAVPVSFPGKALRLEKLRIPDADSGSYSLGAHGSRVLGFMLSFMNLSTRDKLSAAMRRIGLRL